MSRWENRTREFRKTDYDNVKREKATRTALAKTAKEFGLPVSSVRKIVQLSYDYMYARIGEVDVEEDLTKQYTQFQLPGKWGFVEINHYVIVENMCKFGHITQEEFDAYKEKYKTGFARVKNRITNYFKAVKNDKD